MKSILAIALIALLALSGSCFAQDAEVVDISASLEGVWAIEVTQTAQSTKFSQLLETPVNLIANFTRRQGNLVGAVSSSDGSVNALVQFTPDGPFGGSLYLIGGSSSDDEFDAGTSVLSFELRNNTARTLVGSGAWLGISSSSATAAESSALLSKPGFYQVMMTAERSAFVLNVWTSDVQDQQLFTLTGSKVAAEADDQPWYTKFGTPLIFVGAMTLSRVMKSWFGPKAEDAPASQRAGAAGAASGAAKEKKD